MFDKVENIEAIAKKTKLILRKTKDSLNQKIEETTKLINALEKMKTKIVEKDIASLLETLSKINDIDTKEIELKSNFFNSEEAKQFLNEIRPIEKGVRGINDKIGMLKIIKSPFVLGNLGYLLMYVKTSTCEDNIYSSLEEAYAVEAKINNNILELQIIDEETKQRFLLLKKLSDTCSKFGESVAATISEKNKWGHLNEDEQKRVYTYLKIGQLMKEIIQLPLFLENGELDRESQKKVGEIKSIELTNI